MPKYTEEDIARASRTVLAANVFSDAATDIAFACFAARAGHVVVASVNKDLEFAGSAILPEAEAAKRAEELEREGWVLIFGPNATEAEIVATAASLGRLGLTRLEAMTASNGE